MSLYHLAQLGASAESAFCENVNTITNDVPFNGDVELNPVGDRIDDATAQYRLSEKSPGHKGPRHGEFSFETYLNGRGTSLTQKIWQELDESGFGGSDVDSADTTIATATSASAFTCTSAQAASQIRRVGTPLDGRGGGHAYVAASASASEVALPATPNVGDTVLGMRRAFHDETKLQTLQSYRFILGRTGTNQQIVLRGCVLKNWQVTIPTEGGLPRVRRTFAFAYWDRINVSLPLATKVEQPCAAVAGGSLFIGPNNAATRTGKIYRWFDFQVDLGMDLQPMAGGEVVFDKQWITGWARTRLRPKVTLKLEYAQEWETYWDSDNEGLVYKRLLWESNVTTGRVAVIHMPRLFPAGPRPSKFEEGNGQLACMVQLEAREHTVTTSEFTRAAFVLATG